MEGAKGLWTCGGDGSEAGRDAVSSLARALGGFHRTRATERPAYPVAPPAAAGPQAEAFARQPRDAAAGAAGTAAVLAVPPPPPKAGWHAAD